MGSDAGSDTTEKGAGKPNGFPAPLQSVPLQFFFDFFQGGLFQP